MLVDIRTTTPPPQWGVTVDEAALAALADRWATTAMPLPAFDYPGTPAERDEAWWFDYVVLSVSVLACLWPPEGDAMWSVSYEGEMLDDAPGIFAAFSRQLAPAGSVPRLDLSAFANLSDADGATLFAGNGTLQLIPERTETLRRAATALLERWRGSAANLVAEAGRDAQAVANLLTETVPGFQDRPQTTAGTLPFDKLSHLAAAIMASGIGWTFTNYENFPVYPDYMLPRVFRHHGAIVYSAPLAAAVDSRSVIAADSEAEHAIRWATVYAGEQLRRNLNNAGNPVTAPGLDYHLWSQAVLGPDANAFGEHHRTITMRY